ncbi:hypothetical protein BaRGS_00029433, partial [Batillaria attramentaria]
MDQHSEHCQHGTETTLARAARDNSVSPASRGTWRPVYNAAPDSPFLLGIINITSKWAVLID